MIKTVNINLGGIVYQIDEDAFETLRKYLDSLTQYYKFTEGRDEIVSDIESRIAEIFAETLAQSGFTVISLGDVEEVIETMGRPEDFDMDSELFEDEPRREQQTNYQSTTTTTTSTSGKATKRLYRDPDNAIIAGVSSGLSAYFGIDDPLWIRLTFIILTVLSVGMAPIVYIVLWVILPKAITSAQKLEMSGEPVNVNNMEKKIREEFNQVGENLKGFANSNPQNSGLRSLVNGIGKLFGAIAKLAFVFFKIIFGFLLLIFPIIAIVLLIVGLIYFLIGIPLSIKYIFATSFGWILATIGGILTFGIPTLLLIYIPLRIFTKYRVRNNNAGFVAFGLFLIGLICMGISSAEVASYFSEKESITTESTLENPFADTLYVALNNNEEEFGRLDYDLKFQNIFSFTKRLETASDFVELDVEPSYDENIYLEKTFRSSGKNNKNAQSHAQSISHKVKYDNSTITIDPYFGLGKRNKWRNQEVKLKLKIPEGMVVAFGSEMSSILDNVDNSRNANVNTVAGNRWLMNDGVLEPIDSNLTISSTWSKKNMQNLNYKNFDKIELRGNVEVEIVQGEHYEVYLINHNNYKDELEVEKDGSTLEIKRDRVQWYDISIGFMKSRNWSRPKFYVQMPEVKDIYVSGLSHIIMSELTQENVSITLKQQGSAYLDDVNIEHLKSDIYAQSDLRLSGLVDKFELDGYGQSHMEGDELTVKKLDIDLSAQSDANMRVVDKLDVELTGQSDFDYYGNPIIEKSIRDQASLNHKY